MVVGAPTTTGSDQGVAALTYQMQQVHFGTTYYHQIPVAPAQQQCWYPDQYAQEEWNSAGAYPVDYQQQHVYPAAPAVNYVYYQQQPGVFYPPAYLQQPQFQESFDNQNWQAVPYSPCAVDPNRGQPSLLQGDVQQQSEPHHFQGQYQEVGYGEVPANCVKVPNPGFQQQQWVLKKLPPSCPNTGGKVNLEYPTNSYQHEAEKFIPRQISIKDEWENARPLIIRNQTIVTPIQGQYPVDYREGGANYFQAPYPGFQQVLNREQLALSQPSYFCPKPGKKENYEYPTKTFQYEAKKFIRHQIPLKDEWEDVRPLTIRNQTRVKQCPVMEKKPSPHQQIPPPIVYHKKHRDSSITNAVRKNLLICCAAALDIDNLLKLHKPDLGKLRRALRYNFQKFESYPAMCKTVLERLEMRKVYTKDVAYTEKLAEEMKGFEQVLRSHAERLKSTDRSLEGTPHYIRKIVGNFQVRFRAMHQLMIVHHN